MTQNTHMIDENKIWDEDVKTMSYDDLMAAVRFLDQERDLLAQNVYNLADEQNNKFNKQEVVKRAA